MGALAEELPCAGVTLPPFLKPQGSLLASPKLKECKIEQTVCKTLIIGLNDAVVGSKVDECFLFSWPNSAVIQLH